MALERRKKNPLELERNEGRKGGRKRERKKKREKKKEALLNIKTEPKL